MRLVGIDLSMTAPAITVFEGDNTNTGEYTYHFYTTRKKVVAKPPFYGTLQQDWTSSAERFDNLSNWALEVVGNADKCWIEGYSYASSGLVFDIAENGGVLKHKLYQRNIPFTALAPTSIKKFATGKGNSKKGPMILAFTSATGYDINKELGISANAENPSSDIADSYFVLKMGMKTDFG